VLRPTEPLPVDGVLAAFELGAVLVVLGAELLGAEPLAPPDDEVELLDVPGDDPDVLPVDVDEFAGVELPVAVVPGVLVDEPVAAEPVPVPDPLVGLVVAPVPLDPLDPLGGVPTGAAGTFCGLYISGSSTSVIGTKRAPGAVPVAAPAPAARPGVASELPGAEA
jgi:hypothetical protein